MWYRTPLFYNRYSSSTSCYRNECRSNTSWKSIDAVYSADPKLDPNATKFEEISYIDVLNKDLKVMDSTATAMCRDNNIPLLVFGIADPQNIVRAVKGEK